MMAAPSCAQIGRRNLGPSTAVPRHQPDLVGCLRQLLIVAKRRRRVIFVRVCRPYLGGMGERGGNAHNYGRAARMSEIRCVANPQALVGEGPVWDDRRRVLWWIDVKNPRLFRYDPANGDRHEFAMPERIGCVAPRQRRPDRRLHERLQMDRSGDGRHHADHRSRARAARQPVQRRQVRPARAPVRRHHGQRRGRVHRYAVPPRSGPLGARDVHRRAPVQWLDWSPDDRLLYYTDSLRRTIWVYDFDLATGAIDRRRVFARVPDDAGVPDGLCVDREGHVWSAHWGGWRLTRYAPDGGVDRVVDMPVPQPSCPAFGGADLEVLYVSSAAIGMTQDELARAPDGGGLFALDVGVRGLPVGRFAG